MHSLLCGSTFTMQHKVSFAAVLVRIFYSVSIHCSWMIRQSTEVIITSIDQNIFQTKADYLPYPLQKTQSGWGVCKRGEVEPPSLFGELSPTTGWSHRHTHTQEQFAVKAAVADRRWFEEKIRDLWASTVHVFVSVCARMCTVYVRVRLCVCGAFIHVPPVTSSPAWTTNTRMFEVRLTRACVGCHILSLLSQMNWEGWGWWGLGVGLGRESRETCLFLSLFLSDCLTLSRIPIMVEQEGWVKRKMQHCCIGYALARLVRLIGSFACEPHLNCTVPGTGSSFLLGGSLSIQTSSRLPGICRLKAIRRCLHNMCPYKCTNYLLLQLVRNEMEWWLTTSAH